ncbi:MAG: DsbA family oxidoreductase [Alphaproteobacteria bacterium]|nr:DsbA family oxidoreductase [Alphaproteobacteria bacterium]
MKIDIISDNVCPWCYIGKRRLERALAQRDELEVEITWRPFQLNPDMPAGGLDREAYLNAKFGGAQRAEQIYAAIREAGDGEGIDFAFDKITRTPNTIDSHRLLHWAGQAGLQDAVVEVLFQRYFEEGADIGDREVLVAIAAQAGMDGDEVRARFERGDDLELVAAQDTNARQRGVAGVPYFIIAGKYAVSGAQDPSIFLQVLDLAARGGDEGEGEAEAEESAASGAT